MILFYGLLIYTLSVYGLAWLITQSYAFEGLRNGFQNLAYKREGKLGGKLFEKLQYLSNCIVCTSVWIGMLIVATADQSLLFREVFPPANFYDIFIWAGWSASTSWILASKFDNDEEEIDEE